MEHASSPSRLTILDGWRATSILLVLAGHLLPLGPKALQLNSTVAPMGMSLFFTLSGFLIVRFLSRDTNVKSFIIRRLARIVPLSWAAMLAILLLYAPPVDRWAPNFLFYANLPPIRLMEGGGHLWSLCLEMQFYMTVSLLCLLFGRRGLMVLPLLCAAITATRIAVGAEIDIVTWLRADEILAGSTLALIYDGRMGERARDLLARVPVWPMLILLFLASHPALGPVQYVRPYAGALLVGASLFSAPRVLALVLESRPMRYIAEVSYALYIIHGVLMDSWLGAGETVEKYLKRPLLIGATFLLAHLSTFYFEKPITNLARRISGAPKPKHPIAA
jgi:peptidoglycan/LPS O-acetylase OafA/YrhL